MSDIQHQIVIKAKEQDVYKALSSIDGLANWWTRTTTGDSAKVGGLIDFRFNQHLVHMQVEALEPSRRVAWRVVNDATDWNGTEIAFDLKAKDGATVLAFGHNEWPATNDFYRHCSMKWATFLLSLKQYVETGAGAPFPNDIAV